MLVVQHGGCLLSASRMLLKRSKLERVNDANLYLTGFTGSISDLSISHLVSVNVTNGPFLISEFVARSLSEKCEVGLIVAARKSYLAFNPSFDRWILDADFLLQIRLADKSEGVLLYES